MSMQKACGATIKVWDPLVRIFHWSLVLFFFIAVVTEDHLLDLHVAAGYAVALLVCFRLFWGVVGTHHARFGSFVRDPRDVIRYLGQMMTLKVPHHAGHNPAGGVMVIALLAGLLLVSLSGLWLLGAQGQGPLAGTFLGTFNAHWLEEVHEFLANFTLLLVFVHVCGVVISSVIEGENLVRAMLTGRKRNHASTLNRPGEGR